MALASDRYGVEVHAYCVLSNHYHLIVTDVNGDLPRFMQLLNLLVARAMNHHLGRSEALWKDEPYHLELIADESTLIEKLTYTLANAVKHALVERPEDWPGLHTLPEDMGTRVLTLERPVGFFRSSGKKWAEHRPGSRDPLAERVQLRITVPPLLASMDLRLAHRQLRAALEEKVSALRMEHRVAGRRILGPAGVLAQSPFATPTKARSPKRRRRPESETRVTFLQEYRAALHAFRAGKRKVRFPPGTYNVRVQMGAHVRPPGKLVA